MKTSTYNQITYNFDHKLFKIISYENAEVNENINHGTYIPFTRQTLLILFAIHTTAVKTQCEGQERIVGLGNCRGTLSLAHSSRNVRWQPRHKSRSRTTIYNVCEIRNIQHPRKIYHHIAHLIQTL